MHFFQMFYKMYLYTRVIMSIALIFIFKQMGDQKSRNVYMYRSIYLYLY